MQAELERLAMALDPATMMEVLGMDPDPWQEEATRCTNDRLLMLCARQIGKSSAAAVLALHRACFVAGSLVLLISPSQRQSGELFRKVMAFHGRLDFAPPCLQRTALTAELANGSRIVSLPASPETIRGFSAVDLLVIDEAAMVPDPLFGAVTPMLAVSRGRLVALSTPLGQRGWFYDAWSDESAMWRRITATAEQCPRIDPEWLAQQRVVLGERWYRQEFLCEFTETVDQVFGTDAVLAAFSSAERPLFQEA